MQAQVFRTDISVCHKDCEVQVMYWYQRFFQGSVCFMSCSGADAVHAIRVPYCWTGLLTSC